jgi:prepilin-type N-terminal cleavage/methylation domain-containing protein
VDRREDGFTLVELLVAIGIFAVVSVAFYQVLFSARSGSITARDIARTSEEARLGFNRMVRDTREALKVRAASSTSFTVEIDFDQDGTPEPSPSVATGSYEVITYTFNAGPATITATAGGVTEVLMDGVECLPKASPPSSCHPMFRFASSRLDYDTNTDGITDESELMAAPLITNGNSVLDGQELLFVDSVRFGLRVRENDSIEAFYAEAQLRNRR